MDDAQSTGVQDITPWLQLKREEEFSALAWLRTSASRLVLSTGIATSASRLLVVDVNFAKRSGDLIALSLKSSIKPIQSIFAGRTGGWEELSLFFVDASSGVYCICPFLLPGMSLAPRLHVQLSEAADAKAETWDRFLLHLQHTAGIMRSNLPGPRPASGPTGETPEGADMLTPLRPRRLLMGADVPHASPQPTPATNASSQMRSRARPTMQSARQHDMLSPQGKGSTPSGGTPSLQTALQSIRRHRRLLSPPGSNIASPDLLSPDRRTLAPAGDSHHSHWWLPAVQGPFPIMAYDTFDRSTLARCATATLLPRPERMRMRPHAWMERAGAVVPITLVLDDGVVLCLHTVRGITPQWTETVHSQAATSGRQPSTFDQVVHNTGPVVLSDGSFVPKLRSGPTLVLAAHGRTPAHTRWTRVPCIQDGHTEASAISSLPRSLLGNGMEEGGIALPLRPYCVPLFDNGLHVVLTGPGSLHLLHMGWYQNLLNQLSGTAATETSLQLAQLEHILKTETDFEEDEAEQEAETAKRWIAYSRAVTGLALLQGSGGALELQWRQGAVLTEQRSAGFLLSVAKWISPAGTANAASTGQGDEAGESDDSDELPPAIQPGVFRETSSIVSSAAGTGAKRREPSAIEKDILTVVDRIQATTSKGEYTHRIVELFQQLRLPKPKAVTQAAQAAGAKGHGESLAMMELLSNVLSKYKTGGIAPLSAIKSFTEEYAPRLPATEADLEAIGSTVESILQDLNLRNNILQTRVTVVRKIGELQRSRVEYLQAVDMSTSERRELAELQKSMVELEASVHAQVDDIQKVTRQSKPLMRHATHRSYAMLEQTWRKEGGHHDEVEELNEQLATLRHQVQKLDCMPIWEEIDSMTRVLEKFRKGAAKADESARETAKPPASTR